MDTTTLFIINMITNNKELNILHISMVIMCFFIITNYKDRFLNNIESVIKKIVQKKHSFTMTGYTILTLWGLQPKFPTKMIAIMHHLIINKHIKHLEYLDLYYENEEFKKNIIFYCTSNNIYNLEIEKGIYITTRKIRSISPEQHSGVIEINNYTLILESHSKDLIKFINDCDQSYREYKQKISKNKLYHFIYQGREKIIKDGKNEDSHTGSMIFAINIISNLNDNSSISNETFDHIIHDHTDKIIKDIDQLKDLDYYKMTGLKRKKGYLFSGPPGCGKTSTVMAMANYDDRHILEIPFARLVTNKDIEDILNLKTICGIDFKKNEVILLFDEIDVGYNNLHKENEACVVLENKIDNSEQDTEKTKKVIKSQHDKINIGCLLSRLDGIGNYDGLIIVATTNHIEKLDAALYREGRLSLINFDFCDTIHITKFIEKFYKIKLTEKQISLLPDKTQKLPPCKIVSFMEKYSDSIDDLFSHFSLIKNVTII